MNKKITIGTRPSAVARAPADPDAWIRERKEEPMKRLTLEVPADLHAAFKADCALRGVKMVDEIRQMMEARVAERQG